MNRSRVFIFLFALCASAVCFKAAGAGNQVATFPAPLAENLGGTHQTTYALGDVLYASAVNTLSKLTGNTTTTRKFFRQTGDGANSAAPAWDTLTSGDIPDLSATYQPLDQDLTDIAGLTRTRGALIVGGASAWTRVTVGSSGNFVGTDGTDTAWKTFTGTSNQITVGNSSGNLTLSTPQDIGTSSNVTFGTVAAKRTVAAKTADYTVLTTDTNTVFTTTGASGTVIFTLPTWTAGLTYTFQANAAQILEVLAPGTDVIRFGESVSGAGGNVQTTTSGRGNSVKVVAAASGVWIVENATGSTWSVN